LSGAAGETLNPEQPICHRGQVQRLVRQFLPCSRPLGE
jgi:hypothetical protein